MRFRYERWKRLSRKHEILSMKSERRDEGDEGHEHDLEERMFRFALSVRKCVGDVNWKSLQWGDVNQLLRSSDSIAANYTEANKAVSKSDFLHQIDISKTEAAESLSWLRLLAATASESETIERLHTLHTECDELTHILATIHRNSQT